MNHRRRNIVVDDLSSSIVVNDLLSSMTYRR